MSGDFYEFTDNIDIVNKLGRQHTFLKNFTTLSHIGYCWLAYFSWRPAGTEINLLNHFPPGFMRESPFAGGELACGQNWLLN